jgi:hypothetical protein
VAFGENTASSTLTINKPSGVVEGDLLVAITAFGSLTDSNNATWTGDTGWTEAYDQGANPNIRVAWKVAGASEPASYTFTTSLTSGGHGGVVLAFRGAAFDVCGTAVVAASGGNVTASAITVSEANSILLGFWFEYANIASFSTPSGMTLLLDGSGSAAPDFDTFYQNVDAGSSGTKTSGPGAGTRNVGGILLSIKPK